MSVSRNPVGNEIADVSRRTSGSPEIDTWSLLSTGLMPNRNTAKPRNHGITVVLDRCLGPAAIEDLLCMVGDHLDHFKLGFGTSVLLDEEVLRWKIDKVRNYEIDIYPGGTLAEAALLLNVYPQFIQMVRNLGFTSVEVSDGTLSISPQTRRDAIKRALDAGLKVITEVGKKDPSISIPVSELCEQIRADLACGACKVVIEARESGVGIGIFDEDGAVQPAKLMAILKELADRQGDIIWEAPLPKQQAALIELCGPNVNLGNIQPNDVLGLEALRRGLRFETFRTFAAARAASGAGG
jgi:phosphosulfolactate synthase